MTIESELAKEASTLLAPYLPRLIEHAGAEAIKATGKRAGEVTWNRAARLWEKLRPHLEDKPDTAEALREVAKEEEDPQDAETIISFYLKKIIKELPPETITEIKNIVDDAKKDTIVTIASGDRSIAIGGDVYRSTIITGDHTTTGGKKVEIYKANVHGDIVIKAENHEYPIKKLCVEEDLAEDRVQGNFLIGDWLPSEERRELIEEITQYEFEIILKSERKIYINCRKRKRLGREHRYSFVGRIGET